MDAVTPYQGGHVGTWVVRVALACMVALGGCEPVEKALGVGARTPHEAYAESLRDAGLVERALGAAWLAAAERALVEPLPVTLPFRETGFFPGDEADARGYRISAQRGERLVVRAESESDAPARVFLDLYRLDEEGARDHLQSADTVTTVIEQRLNRDGVYAVRIQPELLRAVRYTLTIQVEPTLAFPVDGHDTDDIRSAFGVDRDGGRRVHHGVDIFAPRGTPVLAAAEGRVEARLNRLGGKVVWQRVPDLGSLYYAHLDSQAVESGSLARPGDTVGFVGNTGNAVTTPPHLHFGIYARPGGPVDPFPFLYEPPAEPPAGLDADVPLGGWVRTVRRAIVREAPDFAAPGLDTLPSGAVARLSAGTGDWRRIELTTGRTGFLRATELAPTGADRPLRTAKLPAPTPLRTRPDSTALALTDLAPGTPVAVLGTSGAWQLIAVDDASGRASGRGRPGSVRGWIATR